MDSKAQTIDEQMEAIGRRMFARRLDPQREHVGWHVKLVRDICPTKPGKFIRDLLVQGMRVTAGYYPTAVRGFHEYVVLWKERK
jgi:hypothetical protein